MELLKLLSASEMFAQLLSFFLIFFLLRVFAWKRVLAFLDERKARIAEEFKHIEESKMELAQLKSAYEQKLAASETKARQTIAEAVAEGKKAQELLRRQAHVESQKIIEKARDDIKYELVLAKQELKKQIITLSMQVTEQVIGEKLTEKNDEKIVRDFLDKIDTIE